MSNISVLLRQLADELEQAEQKLEMELLTQKAIIHDEIANVNSRVQRTEDKLNRIGKILMED